MSYKIFFSLLAVFFLVSCGETKTPVLTPPSETVEIAEALLLIEQVEFAQWNPLFQFSAEIPTGWAVDYIPEIESLNIYGPMQAALPARELSQIFIRHFKADRFLTLGTVDISLREERTMHGHPAVDYEITKKPGVADFPHQPSWRNKTHRLTDIRYTKASPSEFFVFAYDPNLPNDVFEAFFDSLRFHNDASSFVNPLDRSNERVSKKPFGIQIDPETSPVQPERFSGTHTGADFEIFPDELDQMVEVKAICGGKLRLKREAEGYGGVAVQDCSLSDEPVTVVYGHLDLSSLAEAGAYLAPGETIGNLGEPPTQTDGERKHLHLSIHKGSAVELRGYVQKESDLAAWVDPCTIICL